MNVNETDRPNYGKKIIETEEITGTPFVIITDTERNETFLALGQYRLTGVNETKETIKKKIKAKDWELLVAIIAVIVTQTVEMTKYENKELTENVINHR